MALIATMSAKGAPGATTTALLLANLWPAPSLVVDADPLGGDIALRLPAEHGPLNPDRGLMSLLPAARRGLVPELVLQHAQTARGGQLVVPGLPGPEQALAASPLWSELASAFAAVPGHDTFVDLGQLHSRSPHLVVAEHAEVLICVIRATAWGALHARLRLDSLAGIVRPHGTTVGVVCVADPREPQRHREAVAAVRDGQEWLVDLGTIALDPKAAVMYEGSPVYRPERSVLVRSTADVVRRLSAVVSPTPGSTIQLPAPAPEPDLSDVPVPVRPAAADSPPAGGPTHPPPAAPDPSAPAAGSLSAEEWAEHRASSRSERRRGKPRLGRRSR
ncbi:MAG: hypothetical protein QM638_10410 [Nocardioides sp.]|uniref:hypothetical protein n=1 Tax=Nocardioides sp. TaxID=35761 RepID=UPI0039E26CBC